MKNLKRIDPLLEGLVVVTLYCTLYFSFFLFAYTVENLDHCDFKALRKMVVRTHVQDLKDVTNNVHYENFRCRTLAGLGVDGKPTKASNK